ncbi:uncharacterized protein I303_100230 [Kwoniella dejecticola CBS 10117]|uniref:Delta 8-(E)-sphingolipid desaturase n=1 Tax=Kwoniella dejecticola CBS 10117 TaxID=1296121 RepID=A0A1A6AEC5_9TREE|nr:delta8-fatty-acid desaturase [Kwoniella dejecticola CBS 10117]OBR88415.1 delta8-fatty-acid desaturase [Kwoniella dejecticola CBS 10117]
MSASHPSSSSSPSSSRAKKWDRDLPLLTRPEIAQRICDGQQLIILHGEVLNVSAWSVYHPGGALALLHFVGRDASDEIEAYHCPETLARMKKFIAGRVELDSKGWLPLTPPITLGLVRHPNGVKNNWLKEGSVSLGTSILAGMANLPITLNSEHEPIPVPTTEKSDGIPLSSGPGTDQTIYTLTVDQLEPPTSELDREVEYKRSKAFQELKKRISEAGLFKPSGWLYGYETEIIRYLLLASGAWGLWYYTNGWIGQMTSALCLGLLFQQLAFVVHDAGHKGITTDYFWDRMIGMTVASWIGGLSVGWWCDNHNIHHLVTNHPEHDPDIQHIPFFAISKDFFGSLWSTYYKRVMAMDAFSKIMISVQHKVYYVVLSLARFNLYANSYIYLLGPRPKRDNFWRYELAGIAWYWFYYLSMLRSLPTWQMRVAYLLVSHIAASPVHVQIVLSHFACPTDDLGPTESFPSRQLRTTMDVICSENIEFIHGGLHLQVTHHLFPRLPRHNLRAASLLVKQYCEEQDIVYKEYGWMDGNKQVLGVLKDVANQLDLLKKVADGEIQERMMK